MSDPITHRDLANLHIEAAEKLLRLAPTDAVSLRKAHVHTMLAAHWERRAERAEGRSNEREKALRTRIYEAVSGYHRPSLSVEYRAGLAKAAEIVLDTD